PISPTTNPSRTPRAHGPRPMKKASTKAPAACAWINPASVFHTRVNSSVTCQPRVEPEYLRTHGKKRSPSFRMKKEIINITATVTSTDDAAEAPEMTPEAIEDICPCKKDVASCTSLSICSASMLKGRSSDIAKKIGR